MTRPVPSIAISAIASFGLVLSSHAQPRFEPIPPTELLAGSALHVALDGTDPSGEPLTFTAVSSDPIVEPTILQNNRSLRIRVANYGTMVFELFDGRAPRVTNRIVELADSGFYNGLTFHRVVNDFVIQGGDPVGDGTGGSGRLFDDQFHVDLQHNRTGMLSMAKREDDTNDSQFFITEGPQRNLDFNHSIFGVLVEGENVRDAISNVPTGAEDRPLAAIVMESVHSFVDYQNAVLVLKAAEGATGVANVTVAVQNATGTTSTQTFRVNVTPDFVDSPPFLADIPPIETAVNTPVTYQLVARDAEGQPAFYLDQNGMATNGLRIPVIANENLIYAVDFNTGLMTITPTNGLTGTYFVSVATAVTASAVDYQVVPVSIQPPAASTQ